ncbi:MAG: aspartate aminotransferase family protein [Terriglobales bacterium]
MSKLRLSTAEFRRLAEQITDLSAEFLESLDQGASFPETSGSGTEHWFRGPLPEDGAGAAALDALQVVAAHSRPPSPRFFAYVFGSGEPVAVLGDYFAGVLNQNVTAWRSAPAAVTIERTVVEWLAEAIGCRGFSGSLCGGGSAANLMGLAMAREAKAPANEGGVRGGMVYASSEAHMSIGKSVALLGLGRQNLRTIPVDDEFRMDVAALERAIVEDRNAGRAPIAVVASAGTVNTGAIDPLNDIADVAANHGLWLHVDGAYGALAAIAVPQLFAGINRADSLSLDPHKWLYQPADCGCLLFKDAGWARVAFSHTGEYTRPLSDDPIEGFAFFEESLELSRRFRALKLWLSLRYHGLAAFRDAIRQDLAHARHLADAISRQPALELLATGPLSAVCFRYAGDPPRGPETDLDRLNAAVLRRVNRERRRVFLSNASIRGKFALRACFVNHRSRQRDVDAVIEEVLEAAKDIR